ncbi:MAG: cytochrome b/b6 domain-containing protein [Mariprofundales bacterium]|nr:cytochrome b/b6 domain-containing protein [Mariprofundales bacterium]
MKSLGYNNLTKVLHLLVVLLMIVQLTLAMNMEPPQPGEVREAWQLMFYSGHRFIGLGILFLIVVHLLHTLRDAGDESAWHVLFPWLRDSGRRQLLKELKMVPSWLKHGPPRQDVGIALPGAIHGAGLLLLLLMGLTGACIFFGMAADGKVSANIDAIMDFHGDILATLLWAFLVGHAGMAFWHEWLGHGAKSRIFFF